MAQQDLSTSDSSATEAFNINTDAINKQYLEESDKRIRYDSNDQCLEVNKTNSKLLCAPHGPLDKLLLAAIPYIESLKGHPFHTSGWDCNKTSKHMHGELNGLKGKLAGIIRTIAAPKEAEANWIEKIISKARLGERFFEACTHGYDNNEGKSGERNGQDGFYGGSSEKLFSLMKKWRSEGSLKGLELAVEV